MKLSTKGRYGLRALVDLALHQEEAPVSIQSIADRQNISERYLEQLMSAMKKAKLVTSTRGAQGGYRLARPAGEISVGDVLRALEGDLRAVVCPAEGEGEDGCANSGSCVTRYVWQRVNESIRQTVDDIWISQLVSQGKHLEEQTNPEKTCEKDRRIRK